ncbi:MAG TPA: hypothetical protein VFV34_19430 [Blastocatellia bacterium]|nr:hypothetical protein [Blastocatellia bacterium]
MPYLITVLLLFLIIAAIGYRYHLGFVVILLVSIVFGSVSYFLAGIGIPRYTGVGRFYSVPFGFDRVRDSDILLSLICWIVVWAVLIFGISKLRGR